MAETTSRCVFGMECMRGHQRSYISIFVEGGWDMDLLEAVNEFVQRQRKRLLAAEGVEIVELEARPTQAVLDGAELLRSLRRSKPLDTI